MGGRRKNWLGFGLSLTKNNTSSDPTVPNRDRPHKNPRPRLWATRFSETKVLSESLIVWWHGCGLVYTIVLCVLLLTEISVRTIVRPLSLLPAFEASLPELLESSMWELRPLADRGA